MPIRVIYPSILSRDQLGLSTGLGAAGCCRCFCAEEPHEMLWEYVGSLQPHVICIYYMYIYVICIYNICYRHQGKQVDRRNFNVLKDQGSQGSTDLFRPSYWAIDAEMLPTKPFNKHVNQNR